MEGRAVEGRSAFLSSLIERNVSNGGCRSCYVLDYTCDATARSGDGSGSEVIRGTGPSEMSVRIDNARKHQQAVRVNRLNAS